MTKSELIIEIKKFPKYSEVKNYILDIKLKSELVSILEELSGTKVVEVVKEKATKTTKEKAKDRLNVKEAEDLFDEIFGLYRSANSTEFDKVLGRGTYSKVLDTIKKKEREDKIRLCKRFGENYSYKIEDKYEIEFLSMRNLIKDIFITPSNF